MTEDIFEKSVISSQINLKDKITRREYRDQYDILKTEKIITEPYLEPDSVFNAKNKELGRIIIKKKNKLNM